MPAKRTRDGKGHRAYRRRQAALKRRTNAEGLLCAWCGEPFLWDAPTGHPLEFTADHPEELKDGGHLVRQDLVPMHRRCNTLKSRTIADVDVWAAT